MGQGRRATVVRPTRQRATVVRAGTAGPLARQASRPLLRT